MEFLLAGLVLAVVAYVHWLDRQRIAELKRENMLLSNRVFVREGVTPLYTPEMIKGDKIEAKPPVQLRSPFASNLDAAKKAYATEHGRIDGNDLPDSIKQKFAKRWSHQ